MPIYEYECTACNDRFERRQRITEEPVKVCPTCGGATRKVLHPVGIIFKGSGWYVTDNRSGSSGRSASGEANGESKPAEVKSDSKTEPKGESKTESKTQAKVESKGEAKPAGKS